MCGRYVFVPDEGWQWVTPTKKNTGLSPGYDRPVELKPNYNVAPMQTMPIVTAEGLEMMQWGLVPSWSKEFKPGFTTINARAETVAEKPLYRTPFKKRRCLVPASGFYEWQKRETYKQPFLFTVKDRPVFYFAGLYDVWYDAKEQPHKSYTIITTEANKLMSDVHDRMPVILEPDEEKFWLNDEETPDELQLLLDPFETDEMSRYEVSRDVGNVKNNSANLLEPINSA